MKKRRTAFLLLDLLIGLALCTLSGCGLLSELSPSRTAESSSSALELHLGSSLLEDIVLSWDAGSVTVDHTEMSVTESSSSRTVTVIVQLRPCQP